MMAFGAILFGFMIMLAMALLEIRNKNRKFPKDTKSNSAIKS
jgi:hypothetical protein